ncbi:MAG: hypothetical protein OXH36_00325 [Bdellovibrionales bacterium]|nr:hypothetical protein [Bdellovibrionales bacterium]
MILILVFLFLLICQIAHCIVFKVRSVFEKQSNVKYKPTSNNKADKGVSEMINKALE